MQQHQLCGARTRAGGSCKRKGRGKSGRCPNHGSESTGPRTPDGKRRMIEAVKTRWAAYRTARGRARPGDAERLQAAAARAAHAEQERAPELDSLGEDY
jgi:hypothetical protein